MPATELRWKAKPAAIARTREGSFNEVLLRYFTTFKRPSDVMEQLSAEHGKRFKKIKTPVRDYLCMRLYALRQRGCFELR